MGWIPYVYMPYRSPYRYDLHQPKYNPNLGNQANICTVSNQTKHGTINRKQFKKHEECSRKYKEDSSYGLMTLNEKLTLDGYFEGEG